MPVKADKDLKLYYSIGEVAEMFGVNDTLLRFWEREFPQIAPKKARAAFANTPSATSKPCAWSTTW